MSTARVTVESMRINTKARSTVWVAHGIDIKNPESKRFRAGDESAITVILDTDGNLDYVFGDLGSSGDVETLDRMIVVLEAVKNSLEDMYAGTIPDPGRCFAQGGWGRCSRDSGHVEPHSFPDPPAAYPEFEEGEHVRSKTEVWEGSPV